MKIKSMIIWYRRKAEQAQDAVEECEYTQLAEELEELLNGKR